MQGSPTYSAYIAKSDGLKVIGRVRIDQAPRFEKQVDIVLSSLDPGLEREVWIPAPHEIEPVAIAPEPLTRADPRCSDLRRDRVVAADQVFDCVHAVRLYRAHTRHRLQDRGKPDGRSRAFDLSGVLDAGEPRSFDSRRGARFAHAGFVAGPVRRLDRMEGQPQVRGDPRRKAAGELVDRRDAIEGEAALSHGFDRTFGEGLEGREVHCEVTLDQARGAGATAHPMVRTIEDGEPHAQSAGVFVDVAFAAVAPEYDKQTLAVQGCWFARFFRL